MSFIFSDNITFVLSNMISSLVCGATAKFCLLLGGLLFSVMRCFLRDVQSHVLDVRVWRDIMVPLTQSRPEETQWDVPDENMIIMYLSLPEMVALWWSVSVQDRSRVCLWRAWSPGPVSHSAVRVLSPLMMTTLVSLVSDKGGHTREHCHGHRIYSGVSYTAAVSLSHVTHLGTLTMSAVEQTSQHDTVPLVGAVVGGTNLVVLTRHDATHILTQPIIAQKLTFKSDALLLKLAVKCFSSWNTLILLTNEYRIFIFIRTTVVLFTALKKSVIDKLKHQCCHHIKKCSLDLHLAILLGVLAPSVLHQLLVSHGTNSVLDVGASLPPRRRPVPPHLHPELSAVVGLGQAPFKTRGPVACIHKTTLDAVLTCPQDICIGSVKMMTLADTKCDD